MRRRALLLTASLLLGAAGCTQLRVDQFATKIVEPTAAPGEITIEGLPIRSGQIFVSEAGTTQSLMLGLMLAEPRRFTHAGIVSIENGKAYVYDTNGSLQINFSGPPTDAIKGAVRRHELAPYLAVSRFTALYDPPPGVDRQALVTFARDHYRRGTPFDAYFDLADSSSFYCTEFVARGLEAAGATARRTMPASMNPSLQVVRAWLKVTSQEGIPVDSLITDASRVALLSRDRSPAQIDAYFAAKFELQRRFTPDQKIGNIVAVSRLTGIRLQPPVSRFLSEVDAAAATWSGRPAEAIDQSVRELARTWLGPVGAPEVTADSR